MNYTTERRAAIANQDAKAYKWCCCCAVPLLLVLLPVFVIGYLASQDPWKEPLDLGATLPYTDEQMYEIHYENCRDYFLKHQADFETLRKQVQTETKKYAYVTFTPENNLQVSKLGLLQASVARVGQSRRVVLKAYDDDRRLGYYSYVYSETKLPSGEAAYRQLYPHWFLNQSYERASTPMSFK